MNTLPQLPSLFYSVGARIETLIERLNDLSTEKFATPSGEKLVSLFIKGAKRLKKLLKNNAGEWLDGSRDRESIESVVRRVEDSATILYSYIEYIEAFRFEKTRSEVILPFELLMKRHFPESQNDIFIFYPQWEFNFTYLNLKGRLRSILFLISLQEQSEFFEDIPGRIAIISFPALERDNILALVVLAHELAHYFDIDPAHTDSQISNSSEVLDAVSIREDKINNWIEECKRLDPAPESWPPILANILYRSRIMGKLETSIPVWLRELTADISAARFLGIGFYLCMRELFTLISTPLDAPYPPNSKRLFEIAREINGKGYGFELDVMSRIGKDLDEGTKKLVQRIQEMMTSDLSLGDELLQIQTLPEIAPSQLTPDQRKERLEKLALNMMEEFITPAMIVVRQKVRDKIPLKACLRLSCDILDASRYLKSYIPPAEKVGAQPVEETEVFDIRMILNAVWFRWLEIIDKFSVSKKDLPVYENRLADYYKQVAILSRLSLRAIELSNFRREYRPTNEELVADARIKNKKLISKDFQIDNAGVLGKKEIINLMVKSDIDESLVIMPLLDPRQITEASIDLTLGNVFIVMKRTRLPSLDFRKICDGSGEVNVFEFQERIQVRSGGEIVLHPNEFVLGSTLEYVALPPDIMAYVIGKSSLGRVGLVIATATHVAPGFKGTITLELSNLGSVPLVLYPTMLIAQLVFHRLCSPVEEGYSTKGVYAFSTGPAFSKYLVRARPT